MRILITASRKIKAKNYVRYLAPLGEVEVITPRDAQMPEYDLLVLSGGEDVHPKYYGEEIRYPDLLEINEARDRLELTLVGRALKDRKPIFGICRGFQVLTVVLGGTLYQDLGREGFNGRLHRADKGDALHRVDFLGAFREAFGEGAVVNSRHHQGLKTVPKDVPDLEILARAEDGLIEAFSSRKLRLLAVQWHPERHDSPLSPRLLEYLKDFIGGEA